VSSPWIAASIWSEAFFSNCVASTSFGLSVVSSCSSSWTSVFNFFKRSGIALDLHVARVWILPKPPHRGCRLGQLNSRGLLPRVSLPWCLWVQRGPENNPWFRAVEIEGEISKGAATDLKAGPRWHPLLVHWDSKSKKMGPIQHEWVDVRRAAFIFGGNWNCRELQSC
jgi:hypothetical protein